MSTTALCHADCRIRNRHLPECPDPAECPGCQPRRAADGLWLCDLHVERLIEDAREAPVLYAALADALVRRGTGGEKTSGTSAGAPVPDDDVMDARAAVRRVLLQLTRIVIDGRGVNAPVTRVGGRVYLDTSVDALSEFVAKHGVWLAGYPLAGAVSNALHAVTRGKIRVLAYPAGSDRLYIGDCPLLVRDRNGAEDICGTRLYQYPDRPLLDCAGCGTSETIEQWQKWMVGDTRPVADAYAIAACLALRWMRPDASPSTIRSWAHRGHIKPVTRPDPTPSNPDRVAIVRDDKNRTQYVVTDVLAYAERAWGAPIRPTRVS